MKKSTLWIIIIILALGLFYFAKKADAPNETQDTTPPTAEMTESNEDAKTEDATTVSDSTDSETVECIDLTAEALGDRKVSFAWEVSEECESEYGYKIVYSKDMNPTDPASWRWQRGPAHRDLTWESLPLGPGHFRICPMVAEDTCGENYSNDVGVDIK